MTPRANKPNLTRREYHYSWYRFSKYYRGISNIKCGELAYERFSEGYRSERYIHKVRLPEKKKLKAKTTI